MQSTTSEFAGFLSWGQSSGDEGFAVDEFLPTELVVDAAGDTQFFPTPYLLDDGAWHMVTVTYDGTRAYAYIWTGTRSAPVTSTPSSTRCPARWPSAT